jgi:Flp pilus assembly secretin CpaC
MAIAISMWRPQPAAPNNDASARWIAALVFARRLAAIVLFPVGLLTMPAQGADDAPTNDFFESQNVVIHPLIDLAAGEGRLLRFNGPVEEVFLTDPTIADMHVADTNLVYIYGKKSGMTNLMARSADHHIRASMQLRVTSNSGGANAELQKPRRPSIVEIPWPKKDAHGETCEQVTALSLTSVFGAQILEAGAEIAPSVPGAVVSDSQS